jgi:hypothetical protein
MSRAYGNLLILLSLVVSQAGRAQRIFHDATRDTQAQAAASASKEVLSGALFEVQLKNLEQLGKQQIETVMQWQEVKMRAAINRFAAWQDVSTVIQRVDSRLAPYLDVAAESGLAASRLKEIKERAAAIPKLLRDIKGSDTHKDVIGDILSHAGDAKEAIAFAENTALKDNPATVTALNEIVATVEQVQKLYTSLKGALEAAAAVKVPLASLRPDPLQTELELLRVEEEHLKALGLIRARQALEVGAIKRTLDAARAFANRFPPTENIEATLERLQRSADRDPLEFALFALHYAAAVAAQQETSADLAALRKDLEDRRYSIQRSAVSAGTYEQTARAAAARLSNYWKAGLKPQDLADLLYHISTAASLPIIAAKQ